MDDAKRLKVLGGLRDSVWLALDYLDELMEDAVVDDDFLDYAELRNILKPLHNMLKAKVTFKTKQLENLTKQGR